MIKFNNIVVMSFEQKQIHKLSRQLCAKQDEHKRQKSIMIQKIELLQSQIMDYQEKDIKNKQLNQSIMMSYKQNESFRQQYTQKQLNTITHRHQEQIKNLKRRHNEEKKRLQEEINTLKCQNDKLKLDIQRIQLQNQKEIASIKSTFQQKLKEKDNDMNNIFQHKFELINERLRQSQEMNAFFKNQLQPKKDKNYSNIEKNYLNIEDNEQKQGYFEKEKRMPSLLTKRNAQNRHILRKNQETISSINLRINRALIQLNPNNVNFNDKLKKIRQKIYQQ